MSGISLAELPKLSAAALCCFGMVLPAMAAPPTARLQSNERPAEGLFNSHMSDKGSGLNAPRVLPAHLDLRPPSAGEFDLMPGADASMRTAEGSERRIAVDQRQSADRENGDNYPGLSNEPMPTHSSGLARGLAERFHREGLPVARLWENHAALVSLGFNQKGKPGLWLVQKTH